MPGYLIWIFLEKVAKLFAYIGDPDQMPQNMASDVDLHCLPFTHFRVFITKMVNN